MWKKQVKTFIFTPTFTANYCTEGANFMQGIGGIFVTAGDSEIVSELDSFLASFRSHFDIRFCGEINAKVDLKELPISKIPP